MQITYSDPRNSPYRYMDLFTRVNNALGYERTDSQVEVITRLNTLISAAYPYYNAALSKAAASSNGAAQLSFLMSIASASTRYAQMQGKMQDLNVIRIENLMYQSTRRPTMRLLFKDKAALTDYFSSQQSVFLDELTINSDYSFTVTAAAGDNQETFIREFWQCQPPSEATRKLYDLNGLDLGSLGLLKTNADLQVQTYLGADLSALEFILRSQLPQL